MRKCGDYDLELGVYKFIPYLYNIFTFCSYFILLFLIAFQRDFVCISLITYQLYLIRLPSLVVCRWAHQVFCVEVFINRSVYLIYILILYYAKINIIPLFRSWSWKHLLYLQLRRCLLERQLRCETKDMMTLAGLALQAEFGDFNVEVTTSILDFK